MSRRKQHPFDLARKANLDIIGKIADRAVSLYANADVRVYRQDVLMDITAVHFGPCKLRLEDLLAADDFNFIHDIIGINRHLDRVTFKLGSCFVPRFAAHSKASCA